MILAIVFNAFSDSVIGGVWEGPDAVMLATMAIGVVVIFVVVYVILKLVCRLLEFDVPDTIACLFCGSVKSLATGVPLARLMFGNDPVLGLIIAPIMLYHVFQLVVLGVARQPLRAAPGRLTPDQKRSAPERRGIDEGRPRRSSARRAAGRSADRG